MSDRKPHLAILGAGPIGLEAALAALDAGLPFTLYESAPKPGGNVREWGHVRLFTPWDLNVSPRMRRHLDAAGAAVPSGDACPTGRELAEGLLDPIAALPEVAPHLRLSTRVVALGREGLLKHEEISSAERASRPFRLLVHQAGGRDTIEHADRVIDATGTWQNPNRLGDGGIPAPGEERLDDEILRHVPDVAGHAADWSGKTVLVVGDGHSAHTALCDLADLAERAPGTKVIWSLRSAWDGEGAAGDPLPERARLNARVGELAAGASPHVERLEGSFVDGVARENGRYDVTLRTPEGARTLAVDRILSLTGYVGDFSLYRQLQVHECYATCGPMKLSAAMIGAGGASGASGAGGDCLAQTSHGADTLTNPEPGFFLLGSKSYGRNNTFLMRVGWDQVGEVFGLFV